MSIIWGFLLRVGGLLLAIFCLTRKGDDYEGDDYEGR